MDPKTLTGASRRPVLDRHLSGRAPGLALLRNRLRTRTGPRLPIAIDNIADLSIDAAVQQPGGGVVDVFSRSRSRSDPRDTGIAQRLLLRPLDRHDGQFILDGAVLFTADLRSLRLGVRRRRQALFLDRGNSPTVLAHPCSHRRTGHPSLGLRHAGQTHPRPALFHRAVRVSDHVFSVSFLPTRALGPAGIVRQFHAVLKRHGNAVGAISAEQLVGRDPRRHVVQARHRTGLLFRPAGELRDVFAVGGQLVFQRSLSRRLVEGSGISPGAAQVGLARPAARSIDPAFS